MDDQKDKVSAAATTAKEDELREEQEAAQKIVEEFQYLLEKSQQLFSGLRELPATGGKTWQPYFQRTFEVYTKLWKFQQQHRFILENKENYGLKRWEVGEIASKVGQLYYHYYLRTSETNYLNESFVFYEAIRERAYFKEILEAKNPALMIKKLRYYARYIVVCLLLNQRELVKVLMEELNGLVDDYTKAFKNQSDTGEWQMVLQEIATFMEAEKKLVPVAPDQTPLPVTHRVQVDKQYKADKDPATKLKLQEAILVGNYQNQVKFSELTLDMYRMLQSLEREPNIHNKSTPTENKEDKSKDEGSTEEQSEKGTSLRRVNPHKYLLYRPSLSQLLVYISNAFKEINDNSAMLLYLSADGAKRLAKGDPVPDSVQAGYAGGVATNSRRGTGVAEKGEGAEQGALVHCLHPNDLLPFTRKPLFLIVDSNNSTAFKAFGKIFNQALMCLLSPTEYPSSIKDTAQVGSLFTLFLHIPLLGTCFISDVTEVAPDVWEKCVELVKNMENIVFEQLSATALDKPLKRFIQDDFLRLFIIRFIICSVVLQSHSSFTEPKHLPSSHPPFPTTLLTSPEVLIKLKDLVGLLKVESLYSFTDLPEQIAVAHGTTANPSSSDAAAAVETVPAGEHGE